MATSNKSKKILEKARKIAAKTKKKKVSKVDVKKKTTSYPEGQNAPQSKKYTQESDKTLSAKATGWRWTKEGAKKLGKSVESKPTTSDIEKYRNETFKLKGKPNKSGPKGVGDGSHRYLYVERRADKADITRKNKLEDGGEMAKGGVTYTKDDLIKLWKKYQRNESNNLHTENVVLLAKYFGSQKDIDTLDKIQKQKKEKGYLSKDLADQQYPISEKLWKKFISERNKFGLNNKLEDGGEMAKGGEVETALSKLKKFGAKVEQVGEKGKKKWYVYNDGQWGLAEDEEGFYASDDDLIEMAEEYASEYAKGGKIPSSEVADFKKYVKSFYGKDETWSEFFPPFGVTNEEVNHAVSQYIDYCKTKDEQWGGGDSFDREIVRDIMLYNRGTKKGLEYQRAIKEIFGKDKKEYGGILQPMTGGVNADPRFDIYNTTMFAEKGAELANGGKLKVVPIYLYEVTYSKHGKKGTFVSKVKAKSEEDAINKWIDETNRTEGVYTIIDVVKSSRTRMEDGGKMAKGGKTHEIKIEDSDDVKFSFKKKTLLEIYESDDSELDNPVGEIFNEGEVFEVTVFGIDKHKYDVQFGDGSVAFIRKADVNVIEVNGEKYSKGGKTHEQGYDDREDESLAMRHGKIDSKDFVGTHKHKEHSRRDDAHFETRHKKAYGGLTNASIELLD